MPSVGGSVESISLDGSEFSVPADADINKKIGGFENEVQANGDGTARIVKTRVPMSLTGVQVSIDDSTGDQELLQELSNRKDYFPVAITLASGEIYTGQGIIVGELQGSSQNQTAPFDVMGPGELVKQ